MAEIAAGAGGGRSDAALEQQGKGFEAVGGSGRAGGAGAGGIGPGRLVGEVQVEAIGHPDRRGGASPFVQVGLGAYGDDLRLAAAELMFGDEQACGRVGVGTGGGPGLLEGVFGGGFVALLAGDAGEAEQCSDGDGGAGGGGVVEVVAGADDQVGLVVRGEVEALSGGVEEAFDQGIGQAAGEVEQGRLVAGLEQVDGSLEQVGVVVEVGGDLGLTRSARSVCGPPAAEQAAAAVPEVVLDEVHGGGGGGEPCRALKEPCGGGEGGDGHTVPCGDDFIIAQGAGSAVAVSEQGVAQGGPAALKPGRIDGGTLLGKRLLKMQRAGAGVFEVALFTDAIDGADGGSSGCVAECFHHLGGGEDIEAALFAFAVGIFAAGEGSAGQAQVCKKVAGNAVGDGLPALGVGRALLGAGQRGGAGVDAEQLGVVVEHLFEVRDEPMIVHAIPGEATGELVVDAPAGHAVERDLDHLEQLALARDGIGVQQKLERAVGGELGSAPEAAVLRVEAVAEDLQGLPRRFAGGAGGGRAGSVFGHIDASLDVVGDALAVGFELRAVLFPGLADAFAELAEADAAVLRAGNGRKVGSGKEGAQAGGEPDAHGPAALSVVEGGGGGHVDLVEVGPLLAVNLDVHEQAVHDGGDGGVFEALAFHHMAPVAGGVADGEEDGAVLLAGELEGVWAPFVPVNGVVGVLLEVGAAGMEQAVGGAIGGVSCVHGRDFLCGWVSGDGLLAWPGPVACWTGQIRGVSGTGLFLVRQQGGQAMQDPAVDVGVGSGGEAGAEASLFPGLDSRSAVYFSSAGAEAVPSVQGYQVLGELGRGGMGTVWRAVQVNTRREVALKFSRVGRLSVRDLLRFQVEVELTARLEHPGIARLYEARVECESCCYAMELVSGCNIDDYCTRNRLDRRQRVRLMLEVVRAVAYAHSRGVLHRDLKPGNVMVSEEGGVRVLDFGLAKLIDEADQAAVAQTGPGSGDQSWSALLARVASRDAEAGPAVSLERSTQADDALAGRLDGSARQSITRVGAVLGTPAYMSPEQARGEPTVDERSDVYALGVMLYELLLGRRPHPNGPLAALLWAVAYAPIVAPRSVDASLPLDLDAIVRRALEREADARYATARALADDLQRYLDGREVSARPLGFAARGLRWTRRRPGLAGAIGLSVAGVLGTLLTLAISNERISQALEARTEALLLAESRRAEAVAAQSESLPQQAVAESTTDFVVRMFNALDPAVARHSEPTVRELVDAGAQRMAQAFPDPSPALWPIQAALTDMYLRLGRPEEARGHATANLQVARALFGAADNAYTARSLATLANCQSELGRHPEAIGHQEQALAMWERLGGGQRSEALKARRQLATVLLAAGRPREAMPIARQALDELEGRPDAAQDDLARSIHLLGACAEQLGDFDAALAAYRRALNLRLLLHPDDHPVIASTLNNIGVVLVRLRQPEEALATHRDALAMRRRIYNRDHPALSDSMHNLAQRLVGREDLAEAADLLYEAHAMNLRLYRNTPNHPAIARSLNALGSLAASEGNHLRAVEFFEQYVSMLGAIHDNAHHPDLAYAYNNLAASHFRLGQTELAVSHMRRAVQIREAAYPDGHPLLVTTLANLARVLQSVGRHAEALEPARRAAVMCMKVHPPTRPERTLSLLGLAEACRMAGDLPQAIDAAQQAVRAAAEMSEGPPRTEMLRSSMLALATVLEEAGQVDQARQVRQDIEQLPPPPPTPAAPQVPPAAQPG